MVRPANKLTRINTVDGTFTMLMCDQLDPFIAVLNEQYLPSRLNIYKELLRNRFAVQERGDNEWLGYRSAFPQRCHFRVPVWANFAAIGEKFAEAVSKSTEDAKFHVDHIVPLKGGLVCGLHCEANMTVIPKRENILKSCRHWPDMPDYDAMPMDEFQALKKGCQLAQYDYDRGVKIEEMVVNRHRKLEARRALHWYNRTIDKWNYQTRMSLEKLKRDWDKHCAIQHSAHDNSAPFAKPHRLAAALAWKPNQDAFKSDQYINCDNL